MNEQQVISQLMGQLGGVFALGIGSGFAMAWVAFKNIVKPFVDAAQNAQLESLQVQITMLKAQVAELTHFKERYMDLLLSHAQPSLKVQDP